MSINSRSLKVTAGALAITAAVFGLAGCGSKGGGGATAKEVSMGTMPAISSVHVAVGHTA